MSSNHNDSRRDFLKGMAGGGLLLAFGLPTTHAAVVAPRIGGWVRVGTDGTVTVLSNTSEIGQGSGTALAQILANELDVAWSAIRLEMAPIEPAYFNQIGRAHV